MKLMEQVPACTGAELNLKRAMEEIFVQLSEEATARKRDLRHDQEVNAVYKDDFKIT